MRLIKIGIANINTTIGAFKTNTDKIIECMEPIKESRCTIGCFHEQTISGYPAEDFVQWESFVTGQLESLKKIAEASKVKKGTGPVFTIGLTVEIKGHLYNSCAVICNGAIVGIVPKEKLPTYGVFYDGRTYSRGRAGLNDCYSGDDVPFGDIIFRFPFGILGVEICEDIWSCDGPMRRRAYSGAEIIVNISSSPFRLGIVETRREMISTRASDNQVTIVYANQYGGNDSLVFDGGCFVNQNGSMILEGERWRENISYVCVDLDRTSRLRHENTTWRSDCEMFLKQNSPVRTIAVNSGPQANENGFSYRIPSNRSFFLPPDTNATNEKENYYQNIIEALITGLDYFVKTKAFQKIGIALSGGKDSLFSLLVCYFFAERRFSSESPEEKKKHIKEFIHCFSMPSTFNSDTTKSIARQIASELGVSFS